MTVWQCAAVAQRAENARGSPALEPGLSPANFLLRPSAPGPATFGSLPQHPHAIAANPNPEPNAFDYVDLSRIQHPVPGSPTPLGAPFTYAPPLVGELSYPASDALDRVGPSRDTISHAATPVAMLPNGSYSQDQLAGSIGDSSKGNVHHNLVGPLLDPISHAATPGKASKLPNGSYSHDELAGSIGNSSKGNLDYNPQVAATDHRAGSGARRSAPLAPVRLFSKAVIYPYASQGLRCQGADLNVLSSTAGGTTYCLDIRGPPTADGSYVWIPFKRHPAFPCDEAYLLPCCPNRELSTMKPGIQVGQTGRHK
jgi:hypothetical protein